MYQPRLQQTEPTHGIAALIGDMLGALLYAWLRWFGARPVAPAEAGELEGALTLVLVAQAAIVLDYEPYVEWEAVPAPWRNGQLLPKRHARALSVAFALRPMRLCGCARGPPCDRSPKETCQPASPCGEARALSRARVPVL